MPDETRNLMLKVVVGSRAHGLADPDSDYDYRGVFVNPTREILSLFGSTKQTSWLEKDKPGGEDDTAWEIGHFLHLALHCNPTILEVFTAPVVEATEEGRALKGLFPAVWHPKRVRDAFVGYGLNQRKKFLERKDARPNKYAGAYLRVLCQAERLLRTGSLVVDMTGHAEFNTLRRWRRGEYQVGEVIDKCLAWQVRVEEVAEACKQQPQPDMVDAFLLEIRRKHWQ